MIANIAKKILSVFLTAEVIGWILVIASLQALSYGISSSLHDTNTDYFLWICFSAAILSFGLSKAKLKGYQVSVGIVALGVVGFWILGAHLATPIHDLTIAIYDIAAKFTQEFFSQIIPAIKSQIPINIHPVNTEAMTAAWKVIVDGSGTLWGRVLVWLIGLVKRISVNDALLRTLAWALILWLFSAWMGWYAGKRNAVTAVLPSVLLLALITSYSEYKVESLWGLVVAFLLLMGVWTYKEHTQQWQKTKVDYSDSVRYDVTQAVLFLTVGIGFLAFVTPSISWKDVRDYLRNRNETADLFGVKQRTVPAKPASTPKPKLPQDHLLSGSVSQSQNIVMTIKTGELPPIYDPTIAEHAPRYYWRTVTYDKYVSAGWVNGSAISQTFPANTPIIPGLLNGYKSIHAQVQVFEPDGQLYWSGILFSADTTFKVTWRLKPESDLFADQSVLLKADIFTATTNANTYEVESYIPQPTIVQLRSAPTDYPEDIMARYFVLPDTVPDRVKQLAKDITKGIENPYDKAKAIESYLRKYEYTLDIPTPPEGQDVADYFLFDLKKGYCDYYATAMVVLARASGIPARFVSGYASGSYDAPNAEYIVRELDAHSWAEIYFPGVGWVEFEPTASQPEIERQETNIATSANQNQNDKTASNLLTRFRLAKLSTWVMPILIFALVVLIYFTVIEQWWYLRLPPQIAIERIYQQLYRLGRPLANEYDNAETAHEFMQKVIEKIEKMKATSDQKKMYSSVQKDVRLLTNAYQTSLFKKYQTSKSDASLALQTWKHLRWRLMFIRFSLNNKAKLNQH